MIPETKLQDVSLLLYSDSNDYPSEAMTSLKFMVSRLTIGRTISDIANILGKMPVDILLLDLHPEKMSSDVLNAFLRKMKSDNFGLSVMIATKPGNFADNITEADFVISKDISTEQFRRLLEICKNLSVR
jgi:hypothetical protein